jgi:hypothetical protein
MTTEITENLVDIDPYALISAISAVNLMEGWG